MLGPYLSRWPEALGLLALPHNAPTSLANFGTLLDDIWYHAGDRSSDVRPQGHRRGGGGGALLRRETAGTPGWGGGAPQT